MRPYHSVLACWRAGECVCDWHPCVVAWDHNHSGHSRHTTNTTNATVAYRMRKQGHSKRERERETFFSPPLSAVTRMKCSSNLPPILCVYEVAVSVWCLVIRAMLPVGKHAQLPSKHTDCGQIEFSLLLLPLHCCCYWISNLIERHTVKQELEKKRTFAVNWPKALMHYYIIMFLLLSCFLHLFWVSGFGALHHPESHA